MVLGVPIFKQIGAVYISISHRLMDGAILRPFQQYFSHVQTMEVNG